MVPNDPSYRGVQNFWMPNLKKGRPPFTLMLILDVEAFYETIPYMLVTAGTGLPFMFVKPSKRHKSNIVFGSNHDCDSKP